MGSARGKELGDEAGRVFARVVSESADIELTQPKKGRSALEEAAMRWTYIVRSRRRWADSGAAVEQAAKATEQLLAFGLTPADLETLAKCRQMEVRIPGRPSDEETWPARIMPWEYLLAAATQSQRREPVTISRVLEKRSSARPLDLPSKPRVLYVESAPGPIAAEYDFSTERALVETYTQARSPGDFEALKTPRLDELRAKVRDFRPNFVHLAGVDTHQGAQILGDTRPRRRETSDPSLSDFRSDGYVLAGSGGEECYFATANEIGLALTADGKHPPTLVVLNFGNSGSRVASRAVQAGARAAVGFQDAFDDDAAELFFATLYAELRESKWNLVECFRTAWETVRARYATLTGTGVILWSDQPLLVPQRAKVALTDTPRVSSSLTTYEPETVALAQAAEHIRVDVTPVEAINYSELHNGGDLFDTFRIMPEPQVRAFGVEVRVVLHAGAESAVFERVVQLEGRVVDLRRDIRVALGATLVRSVHESIMTTLLVEVRWGRHILEKKTFPVRLLPVDQWRDAKRARFYLPSFVFPRDAAVGTIIKQASKYVRVLRDDPAAGFEGYQCISSGRPNDTRHVDLQIQAIWSAIIHEWNLTYINPPPSFSSEMDSQRLRTPSMIYRDRCGTCIDLALLFAACCELVDIYPVIFLLEGHAFPGYWRSGDYHDQFRRARLGDERIDEIAKVNNEGTNVGGAQRVSWRLSPVAFPEIAGEVRAGRLVPLETVRLTENCGFAESIEAGVESLADREEFDSLIDIYLAREAQITPLPLWGNDE